MSSLRDWFRYVDQQSRPARRLRGEEGEPPPASWRPWMEPPEDEEPPLAEIPLPIGSPAGTFHGATPEYEDPTLHDELAPMPEYEVPNLSPPRLQIEVPRFGAAAGAAGGTANDEEAGRVMSGAPPRAPEVPDRPALDSARRMEILTLLRGAQGGAEGGGAGEGGAGSRERAHESREELIQRLVDPTLTLEETALLLGVCAATVRRYTNRGQLRHFRTAGNQRRFRLSDVLAFLEQRGGAVAPGDAGRLEGEE